MKLYFEVLRLLLNRYIRRQSMGEAVRKFAERIRRFIKRFGKMARFRNLVGSNHALDLYTKWIYEETDFAHERHNIETYARFADSVNGKIKGAKVIKVPKLYTEFCTENVLVMEFVNDKTINQIELTSENRERIARAMNDYMRNSFYALLHNQPLVFHGDPHGGNIYLDDEGNVGFLDMGLIFELTDSERKMLLEFFLCAYTGNTEKLLKMLKPYSEMNEKEWEKFADATQEFCKDIREKEVTYYFMDMVNVCRGYKIVPPTFLFAMAKAFVCLNGISSFTHNQAIGRELLKEQVTEFLIERSLNDCKAILKTGAKLVPKMVSKVIEGGLAAGVAADLKDVDSLALDVRQMIGNAQEAWGILREGF